MDCVSHDKRFPVSTIFQTAINGWMDSLRKLPSGITWESERIGQMCKIEHTNSKYSEALKELLSNGMDPRHALFVKAASVSYWSTLQRSNIRPEEFLRAWPSSHARYCELIQELFPDVIVHAADIYWDCEG